MRISCETNFLGFAVFLLNLLQFMKSFLCNILSILRGAIERYMHIIEQSSRLSPVKSYFCSLCCLCCLDDDCEAHENIPS